MKEAKHELVKDAIKGILVLVFIGLIIWRLNLSDNTKVDFYVVGYENNKEHVIHSVVSKEILDSISELYEDRMDDSVVYWDDNVYVFPLYHDVPVSEFIEQTGTERLIYDKVENETFLKKLGTDGFDSFY